MQFGFAKKKKKNKLKMFYKSNRNKVNDMKMRTKYGQFMSTKQSNKYMKSYSTQKLLNN